MMEKFVLLLIGVIVTLLGVVKTYKKKVDKANANLEESKRDGEALGKAVELFSCADEARKELKEKTDALKAKEAANEEGVQTGSVDINTLIDDWNNGL